MHAHTVTETEWTKVYFIYFYIFIFLYKQEKELLNFARTLSPRRSGQKSTEDNLSSQRQFAPNPQSCFGKKYFSTKTTQHNCFAKIQIFLKSSDGLKRVFKWFSLLESFLTFVGDLSKERYVWIGRWCLLAGPTSLREDLRYGCFFTHYENSPFTQQ